MQRSGSVQLFIVSPEFTLGSQFMMFFDVNSCWLQCVESRLKPPCFFSHFVLAPLFPGNGLGSSPSQKSETSLPASHQSPQRCQQLWWGVHSPQAGPHPPTNDLCPHNWTARNLCWLWLFFDKLSMSPIISTHSIKVKLVHLQDFSHTVFISVSHLQMQCPSDHWLSCNVNCHLFLLLTSFTF